MITLRSIVPPPPSPDRRGTVLVGILVGLMLLASALVAVAISGRREQDLTMRRMESMRAAYAEEAAAQIAVRELITQQDDDGDGIVGKVAAGNLASGIIIGTSRAAAELEQSIILPQGSNGLATRGGQINLSVTNYVPGLYLECFTLASNPVNLGNVNWNATPTAVGIVPTVNMNFGSGTPLWVGGPTTSNWAAYRFRGTITIPAAGNWTFSTTSDDGSILWINGVKVVDNDGVHTVQTRSGSISLPAGSAFFDLRYFNLNNGEVSVSWAGPSVATQLMGTVFTCDPVLSVPPVSGSSSISLAGAGTNGYWSKSGAYGGANITSNFSAQTNATTASALAVSVGTLSGNALCGVGGTPGTVITTASGGTISGTRTAAATQVAHAWTVSPLSATASSGALSVTGTTTIYSNARYSSITLNTANAKIAVSGHRVIQCDGAFTIGSNCSIDIPSNGSLVVFMTGGNLAMSGTSQANATTSDPRRLRVVFTSSGRSMTMANSAVFHGYVLNPGGGLTITGGSTPAPTFFGAYHGTTISTTSTALFRADASFGSTTASTNLLTVWRQTQ